MEKEYDIVFIKPEKFGDCTKCVEYIKEEKIVHINLYDLDEMESQRILDYISGAVFIQEGQIVNPGEKVFCTIPKTKKFYFDDKARIRKPTLNSRYDEEEEIIPTYKER